MKNTFGFYIELGITFIVALALSVLFGVLALFVMGSFSGPLTESNTQWVHAGSGAVMGLVLGYKLNSLIRTYTADTPKKKKK